MKTFQRCDNSVNQLANEILTSFETHKPVLDARVAIDYVFAFPECDEHGEPMGPALTLHGVRALGICRKTSTKERALGHGDAEICIDGQWWQDAPDEQRRSLLDHELHHIEVKVLKNGRFEFDDLNRPVIKMRPHDFQFGWFTVVAARHGKASMSVSKLRRCSTKPVSSIGRNFQSLPLNKNPKRKAKLWKAKTESKSANKP